MNKFLTAILCMAAHSTTAEQIDIIIDDVRILDGTGNPWYQADIAVSGEKVLGIGDYGDEEAATRIDGSGLYAAPGFIDTHSHASNALVDADRSHVPGLLSQGVTTVFINPDGGGTAFLGAQANSLQQAGTSVNVAMFIPHGAVRKTVMGDADRAPTETELAQMQALVKRGMEVGAFGLSSGTFYAPGSFSENSELIALSEVVAEYGGAYQSHIRDESNYNIGLEASVNEVIEVGKHTGIPVVITHIKALGPPVWGLSETVTRNIEQARADGIEVYTDQYPYIASHTSLHAALLPRWAFDGGREAVVQRLRDESVLPRLRKDMEENLARRGGPDRIQFSRAPDQPQIIGQTLKVWADNQEQDYITAAIEILKIGTPSIISFNMSDNDIETFMRAPWNMTASDGRHPVWKVGAPHPRGFGSFPRKIRHYVLERKVVTLPDAIRSMTTLPAQVYKVHDRGQLKAGYFADITLFDLDTISDRATFDNPWQLSEGVHTVIVNGEVAWQNNETKGKHGIVLHRQND